MPTNGIASATDFRQAGKKERQARAERLELPSGLTVLAVKPDALEWILSGRVPQRLLNAAIEVDAATGPPASLSKDDLLELSQFAVRLVTGALVEPSIGDGPGQIALEEIPIGDRVFIFQWACRAVGAGEKEAKPAAEEVTSPALERFRQK